MTNRKLIVLSASAVLLLVGIQSAQAESSCSGKDCLLIGCPTKASNFTRIRFSPENSPLIKKAIIKNKVTGLGEIDHRYRLCGSKGVDSSKKCPDPRLEKHVLTCSYTLTPLNKTERIIIPLNKAFEFERTDHEHTPTNEEYNAKLIKY